ncbi:MAG: HD domain-containing protein [Lachnospiraceae bacterium]
MLKKKIIAEFENYAGKYDLSDPKIYLKYVHTGQVAKNSERIAKSLQLSEEDTELAWEIGMLHDIGRFEQLRRFHTFQDAVSINHAEFGADLLFREHLIRTFDEDPSKDEMIEKAIRYHSLYRLPEGLTERELLFCRIIRDADKVDIFRANYETGLENVYSVTTEELRNSGITPAVYETFQEEHAIPRNLHRTVADHLVGHIALAFELVYPESRKLAISQGYLWKLMDTPFDNPQTVEIMDQIKNRMKIWYEEQKRDARI